ncbi:MAG: hypothetical protein NC131_10735, partial [Roseburia sp.]|nr:hypothetical protein [Roseburia sp.]
GDYINGVSGSLTPQFVRQGGSVGEGPWLNNAIALGASGISTVKGNSAILRSDGTVWTWGNNDYGQLGDNSTGANASKQFPNPVLVEATGYTAKGTPDNYIHKDHKDVDNYLTNTGKVLDKVTELSVGHTHMLALLGEYELGPKTTGEGDAAVTAIDISRTGTPIYSWGNNENLQLGRTTPTPKTNQLAGVVNKTASDAYQIYGIFQAMYLDYSDEQRAAAAKPLDESGLDESTWKLINKLKDEADMRDLVRIAHVSAGSNYSGLDTEDGDIYTWGANATGQLGISVGSSLAGISGNFEDPQFVQDGENYYELVDVDDKVIQTTNDKGESMPVQATYLTNTQGLSVGYLHALVVNHEGFTRAWGRGNEGQIGNYQTESAYFPMHVGPDPYYSLEIQYSTLNANGKTTTYVKNTSSEPPLALTLHHGDSYSVTWAEGKMHQVYYKGFNLYSDAKEVDAWGNHVIMASSNTDVVKVWQTKDGVWTIEPADKESFGTATVSFYIKAPTEKGTPIYSGAMLISVVDDGAVAVPMVAAGDDFTVALRSDGTVWSWGKNNYGQLGTGLAFDATSTNRTQEYAKSTPVQVIFPKKADGSEVRILTIAVGGNHVLAVTEEQTVYAWGLNTSGQLGLTNNNTAYSAPQLVTGANGQGGALQNVVRVAAGDEFSMALTEDGSVYTWGANTYGQLGINTWQNRTSPSRLLGYNGGGYMSSVAGIAAGGSHAMVIRSDGAVFAWGLNSSGQLGNNDQSDVKKNLNVPTKVYGTSEDKGSKDGNFLSKIASLSLGTNYSVALTREGHVLAWGANDKNQLGADTSAAITVLPQVVKKADGDPLEDVVEISAGGDHTVALSATLYVCPKCGESYYLTELIPQGTVNDLDTIETPDNRCPEQHIYYTASPNYETLTCKSDGCTSTFNKNTTVSTNTVYGWGGNQYSELGMNDTANRKRATESLFSQGKQGEKVYSTYFDNYTSKAYGLASGMKHTAILGSDGYIYSMGQRNTATPNGAMGTGSLAGSATPVRTGAREDSIVVSNPGVYESSGIYNNASVADQVVTDVSRVVISARGVDSSGKETSKAVTYTLDVGRLMLKEYTGFNMILPETTMSNLNAGRSNVKVTIMDPSLAKARWTNDSTLVFEAARNDKFGSTSVTLDYNNNGHHYRYTFILYVKDGNGSTKGLTTVPMVEAGAFHSVLLRPDGSVWAWGQGTSGQLGHGVNEKSAFPVQVLAGAAAGTSSAKDGYLTRIVSVATGSYFNLALDEDGVVWAWGANNKGQLGVGDTRNRNTPVKVSFDADTKIVAIAAAGDFGMALDSKGYVWSWGNTTYGQGGYGWYNTANPAVDYYVNLPRRVINGTAAGPNEAGDTYNYLSHIVAIEAGSSFISGSASEKRTGHAVAIRSNGTVYTWGGDSDGQMGNGYTADYQAQPVAVLAGENDNAADTITIHTQSYITGQVGSYYQTNEYFSNAAAAAAGSNQTLILRLKNAGTADEIYLPQTDMYAMGSNAQGQLGLPRDTTAVQVTLPTLALAANTGEVTIVDDKGAVVKTTLEDQKEFVVQVEAGNNYSGMRTVKSGLTARENQNNSERNYAYLWGANNRGQLGTNDTSDRDVPARVLKGEYEQHNTDYTYLEGVYDIALGDYHTLAADVYFKNGTDYAGNGVLDGRFGYIWGWGNNATTSSGTEVLGQLSNLVSPYLNYAVAVGARESMQLMVDYMEAVNRNTNMVRMAFYEPAFVEIDPTDSSKGTHNLVLGANESVVSATWALRTSGAPNTTTPTVPKVLTLGADENLVIYKENTHLHYSTGFALYPLEMDLRSTYGESWDILSSNSDITSVSTTNTGNSTGDQKAMVFSTLWPNVEYKTGKSTITLTSTYNNDTDKALKMGVNGQVLGDYGLVADPVRQVVTGQYVYTLDIDLQPSSDAIIPNTTAGLEFTAILSDSGNVWVWGSNQYGQLGQGNTVGGSTGIANGNSASNVSVANYSPAVRSNVTPNPQKVMISSEEYLSGIKAIAAGQNHMVALDRDGRIWTWGSNSNGQLGYGSVGGSNAYARQLSIREQDKSGQDAEVVFVAISAGAAHTLALTITGEIWAWGANNCGQVGSTVDFGANVPTPHKVLGYLGEDYLSDVVMISAGGHTSVALKSDSTVWAWGQNANGQLGINSVADQGTPAQTLKGESESGDNYIRSISTVSAGLNHVLVIQTLDRTRMENGTQVTYQEQKVWGWGSNEYGQLSDGLKDSTHTGYNSGNYLIPVQVYKDATTPLKDVKAVYAGHGYSAAIYNMDPTIALPGVNDQTLNAQVLTWGYNREGQLGLGMTTTQRYPTIVLAGETTARTTDASADVADTTVDTPGYKVNEDSGYMTTAKFLGLGQNHMSLLRTDGTFWAWGNNSAYQLGAVVNTLTDNYTPVMSGYRSIGYFDLTDVQVQVNGDSADAAGTDATDEINGATFNGVGGGLVTVGNTATVAQSSGWHYRINENQQLRLQATRYIMVSGTRDSISTQLREAAADSQGKTLDNSNGGRATSYVTVSCMDQTIAVLSRDDATGEYILRPAGRAEYGTTAVIFKVYEATKDLLGRYYVTDGTTRKVTSDLSTIEDGWELVYQCVGESVLQLEVYPASGITTPMVVSGRSHTLALKADGTVWAWGANNFGQLGIATSVNRSNRDSLWSCCGYTYYGVPINPHTVYGKYYTTAWNAQGDSVLTSYSAPQKVLGSGDQTGNGGSGALSNIIQVAAGDYTSYALTADGKIYSWGYNNHGELGNGAYNYTYQYQHSWCHHFYYSGYWCSNCREWHGSYYHDYNNCHYVYDAAVRDNNAYSPVLVADIGATIQGNGGDAQWGGYFVTGASSYVNNAVQISAGRDFAVALRADGTAIYWGNSGKYQSLDYIYADFTQNYGINPPGGECGRVYTGGPSPRSCYGPNDGAADTIRQFENAMRAGDGTVGSQSSTYIYNKGCSVGNFYYYNQSGIFKTTPVAVLGPGGTGRLGDNTLTSNYTTSELSAGANGYLTAANNTPRITKLAAGDEFVVALMSDGTVYTWGYQGDAVTGLGSTGDRVLNNDGTAGTMGDNTSLSRIYPVQVRAGEQLNGTNYLQDIVDIAVGDGHILALDSTGAVYAWGDNRDGQLGTGTERNVGTYVKLPVKVVLTGTAAADQTANGEAQTIAATRIYAGGNSSALTTADGTVYAWGDNSSTQFTFTGDQDGAVDLNVPTTIKAGESKESHNVGSDEVFTGANMLALDLYQSTIYHDSGALYAQGTVGYGARLRDTDNKRDDVNWRTFTGYLGNYKTYGTAAADSTRNGAKTSYIAAKPLLVGARDDDTIYISDYIYVVGVNGRETSAEPAPEPEYRRLDPDTVTRSLSNDMTAKTAGLDPTTLVIQEGDAIRLPLVGLRASETSAYGCPVCKTWYEDGSAEVIHNDDGTVTLHCSHMNSVTSRRTVYACTGCDKVYEENDPALSFTTDAGTGSVTVTLTCVHSEITGYAITATCPTCDRSYNNTTSASAFTIGTDEEGNVTVSMDCPGCAFNDRLDDEHVTIVPQVNETEYQCEPIVEYVEAVEEVPCGYEGDEPVVETVEAGLVDSFLRYLNVGTNLYETNGTVGASDYLFAFNTADSSKVGTEVAKVTSTELSVYDFDVISSDESILTVYYHDATKDDRTDAYFELRTMPNAFGEVSLLIRHKATGISRVLNLEVRPKSDLTESTNIKLTAPKVVYGENFALALMADGTVWGWGDNTYGQLGDGTSDYESWQDSYGTWHRSYSNHRAYEYNPVQVRNSDGSGFLTDIVDIAAGANFSFAIRSDGTIFSWGYNKDGQLGTGSTSDRHGAGRIEVVYPTPATALNKLGNVVKISAGYDHAVALRSDGTVVSWGVNTNGVITYRDDLSWDSYDGYSYTAGLVTMERGALINNVEDHNSIQDPVNAKAVYEEGHITNVAQVHAGNGYTMLVMDSGAVYTVGAMYMSGSWDRSMGDTNLLYGRNPSPVREGEVNVEGYYLRDALTVAASHSGGNAHALILTAENVKAVKAEALSASGLDNDAAAGNVEHIADRSAGIMGIGSANSSQLGPDRTGKANMAVTVNSIVTTDSDSNALLTEGDRVVNVAVGGLQSGALTKNGTAYIWGSSASGITILAPDAVNSLATDVNDYGFTGEKYGDAGKVRQTYRLAFSRNSGSILKSDGTVWAWGLNYYGQLGVNSSNTELSVNVSVPRQVYYAQDTSEHLRFQKVDVVTEGVDENREPNGTKGQTLYSAHAPRELTLYLEDLETFYIDPAAVVLERTSTFSLLTHAIWYPGLYTSGESAEESKKRKLRFLSVNPDLITFSDDVPGLARIDRDKVTNGSYTYVLVEELDENDQPTGRTGQLKIAFFSTSIGKEGTRGEGDRVAQIATPKIIAGEGYTYALRADGTVWAWGSNNSNNMLHSGNTANQTVLTPSQVRNGEDPTGYLTGVKQIVSGDNFILVLAEGNDGEDRIYGWGVNTSGQLGLGSNYNNITALDLTNNFVRMTHTVTNSAPAKTLGYDVVRDMSYDTFYSYNGGYQASGKAEFGTYNNSVDATPDGGPAYHDNTYRYTYTDKIEKISAGGSHAAALMQDGTVYVWGLDTGAQLGRDKMSYQRFGYAFQLKASDVADVALGGQHTLLLKTDGTVWAFGTNAHGQIGVGNTSTRYEPVKVMKNAREALTDIVTVEAGTNFSLALDIHGDVWIWGHVNGVNETYAVRVDVPEKVYGIGAFHDSASLVVREGTEVETTGRSGMLYRWATVSGQELNADRLVYNGEAFVATAASDTAEDLLTGALRAGVSGTHTMVLLEDGSVFGMDDEDNRTNDAILGDKDGATSKNGEKVSSTRVDNTGLVRIGGQESGLIPVEYTISGEGTALRTVTEDGEMAGIIMLEGQTLQFTKVLTDDPYYFNLSYYRTRVTEDFTLNTSENVDGQYAVEVVNGQELVTVNDDGTITAGKGVSGTVKVILRDKQAMSPNGQYKELAVVDLTINRDNQIDGADGKPANSFTKPMVAAGNDFTLALTADGKVYSWGITDNGVLGRDTSLTPGNIAGQVSFTKTVTVTTGEGSDAIETESTQDMRIVAIAAGGRHALAVDEEGGLWSWGWNYYGQAGLGSTVSTAEPVLVTFPTYITTETGKRVERTTAVKIAAVAAGEDFSLALDDQGQVWGFGRNDKYQTGTSSSTGNVTIPQPVVGFGTSSAQFENTVDPYKLDEVVAIATGARHSVALTASGIVYTWGDNDYGQLGQGQMVSAAWQPRELLSGENPANSYNPALETPTDADPSINGGKLEDKNTFAHEHTVVAIAAGETHTLILVDDATKAEDGSLLTGTNAYDEGQVYAFGYNYWGSLGNGTQVNTWFPTRVKTTQNTAGAAVDIKHIAGISAGMYASYAFTSDGQVYTWGQNTYGQLADGSAATKLYAAINYFDQYTNENGDFIAPTDENTGLPIQTGEGYLTDIRSIAVGTEHAVMIRNDGAVLTSGRNDHGQLGGSDLSAVTTPVIVNKEASAVTSRTLTMKKQVDHLDVEAKDGVYTMSNQDQMTLSDIALVVNNSTLLNVFGLDVELDDSNLSLRVTVSDPIVDVVENKDGSFTLRPVVVVDKEEGYKNGVEGTTVVTVTDLNTGTAVSFLLEITSKDVNTPNDPYEFTSPMVAAGDGFVLALRSDGTVWAWGKNDVGQLGIDSNDKYVNVPTQVVRDDSYRNTNVLRNIVYIAAGSRHALAVDKAGRVWSWGSNEHGQLGRTAYDTAWTNTNGALAVDEDGRHNEFDEDYYRGKAMLSSYTGQKVFAGGSSSAILNGTTLTVLTTDENNYDRKYTYYNVVDADFDDNGRLHTVSTTDTLGGKKVVSVAAGANHVLRLSEDGYVYAAVVNSNINCNAHGQLGIGTTSNADGWVQVLRPDRSPLGTNDPVVEIAAGGNVSAAVTASGLMYTWGEGKYGQMGDGTTYDRLYATELSALSSFFTPADQTAIGTGISADQTKTTIDVNGVAVFGMNVEGEIYGWGNKGQSASHPALLGTGTYTDESLIPVAVGANKEIDVAYAAIIQLTEQAADMDTDALVQLLNYYGFDRVVGGELLELEAEQAADEPMAVMTYSVRPRMSARVRVPDMNEVIQGTDTLFNAANPLPDRVVLGENQIFIVKKSTVYEVDTFHLNLLRNRS